MTDLSLGEAQPTAVGEVIVERLRCQMRDGSSLVGDMSLRVGAGAHRFSTALNEPSRRFLVLTDAVVSDADGNQRNAKTLMVAVGEIVTVEPV